jgi:hypothetical protein
MSLPRRLPPVTPIRPWWRCSSSRAHSQGRAPPGRVLCVLRPTIFPVAGALPRAVGCGLHRGQRPAGVGSGASARRIGSAVRPARRRSPGGRTGAVRSALASGPAPDAGDATFDPSLLVGVPQPAGGWRAGRAGVCRRARFTSSSRAGSRSAPATPGLDACARACSSLMSRLECARETIRLLLEDLEADETFPAWATYWERYVETKLDPRAKPQRWKPSPCRPAGTCWRSGRRRPGAGTSWRARRLRSAPACVPGKLFARGGWPGRQRRAHSPRARCIIPTSPRRSGVRNPPRGTSPGSGTRRRWPKPSRTNPARRASRRPTS